MSKRNTDITIHSSAAEYLTYVASVGDSSDREGSRQVNREVIHYNLQMIIAVRFKVNNDRAVRFRKWAGQIVKDYMIQGWMMDKERLKKEHMGLTTWESAPDGKIVKADIIVAKTI